MTASSQVDDAEAAEVKTMMEAADKFHTATTARLQHYYDREFSVLGWLLI